MTNRRHFLALSAAVLATGCATVPSVNDMPPIVFVHGNGDNAGLWQAVI